MKKYISKFHYLSQDLADKSHLDQVKIACQSGANWVQYRCLTKSDEDLIKEINEIASICDDWGTTLILTNHYHLLDQVDAQGVHMEDMKADFNAIRNAIGSDKTLGASANTMEDIQRIADSGDVDYIGCGPFAITKTKPNDYPLIGFEGYRKIIKKMQDLKIDIPIIAVGGINLTDFEELLKTGIYGIAVAASVNLSENPDAMIKAMHKTIY